MNAIADDWDGLDADALNSPDNVLLQSGNNFGLFEWLGDGEYAAHCLYSDARGLTALKLSKLFMKFFLERYEVKGLKGLTPVEMRGAVQLALAVGFKPLGYKTIQGRQYLLTYFPLSEAEKVLNYE